MKSMYLCLVAFVIGCLAAALTGCKADREGCVRVAADTLGCSAFVDANVKTASANDDIDERIADQLVAAFWEGLGERADGYAMHTKLQPHYLEIRKIMKEEISNLPLSLRLRIVTDAEVTEADKIAMRCLQGRLIRRLQEFVDKQAITL